MTIATDARVRSALFLLVAALSSCGVGYNRVLFFTKTNAGIDVEAQPPTAEISIARREGVIEPTFEGGQTLPVMASFTSSQGSVGRLIKGGVAMTFSTGAAALAMSKNFGDPTVVPNTRGGANAGDTSGDVETYYKTDQVRVSAVPEPKPNWLERIGYWFIGGPRAPYGAGEMAPLIFCTDGTLGLKALFSGAATGTTLQFGFRRKELAWTPVTIQQIPETAETNSGIPGAGLPFRVDMPSLIATVDSDYKATAEEAGIETELQYVQYFATGKAATYLALQPTVRSALVPRMIPDLKGYTQGTLDKNRVLAESLHSKTLGLVPGDTDNAALVVRLHDAAVAIGYLDVAISGFATSTPQAQRDDLAAKFQEASKKPMADDSYTSQLRSLLALFGDGSD